MIWIELMLSLITSCDLHLSDIFFKNAIQKSLCPGGTAIAKNPYILTNFSWKVHKLARDSSEDLCKVLTRLTQDYGIPETVTTDVATNYTLDKVEAFKKQ